MKHREPLKWAEYLHYNFPFKEILLALHAYLLSYRPMLCYHIEGRQYQQQ